MNQTNAIRTYCLQNPGKILDSAEFHHKYFEIVPYKTFLKILNRLRDEKILIPVSKGVWKISDGSGEDTPNDDESILKTYASGYNGMVVGYAMYNALGVSDHRDEFTDIYTSVIPTKHKTVLHYRLTGVKYLLFDRETKDLITILELLENKPSIIDCDLLMLSKAVLERLPSYNGICLRNILTELHYQYGTVITLERVLKDAGYDKADCTEIYRECCTNA